jgi:hypothetical protein
MRTAKWMPRDPAYLALALLPWLVLAVVSAWIYNPLNGIDYWIYFGYFLNYPRYVAELFPNRYYGSRLPWVLPGYLLHLFLNPKTARYILHLSFYYAALFSLYGLLRRSVGARVALLTAVLFGTHSFVLAAIGWDYVDGAGITYDLLALLCISVAVAAPHPRYWILASGAAAAAMFYCNAFLISFVPFLPAFYLYQQHQGLSQDTLRIALRFALWFTCGALLVTVFLGAVNYRVGGSFWFYGPSLRFVVASSSKPNEFFIPGWSWTAAANWLALPLTTALGSTFCVLLSLIRRTFAKRDLRLFFLLQFLASSGIFIVWHIAGGLGLEAYYYTSYLLPSAFLAIGCMFTLHFERWQAWSYWLFLAVVTLALVASLALGPIGVITQVRRIGWVWMSIGAGICFALNAYLRNRWQFSLLILCGLWMCQASFGQFDSKESAQRAAELSRVAESAKLVGEHTREDPLRFWYDAAEPLGSEFNAINSTFLWRWAPEAIINRNLTAIAPESSLQPGVEGVILSSRDDALQQANRALNEMHLQARTFGTGKIDRDGVRYQLLFFRVEPFGTAGLEVPLQLVETPGAAKQLELSPASDAAPFPAKRWVWCWYPRTDGKLEIRPNGVHVTTHAGRFSYSAQYPAFKAVKSGYYRFVLEFEDLKGGFQFGGLSADSSHWVVPERAVQRTRRGNGTRTAYASLAAGEQVVLMVCNYIPQGTEHSSTFVIKSIRAFATFSQ